MAVSGGNRVSESLDIELRQRIESAGLSGDALSNRTIPDIEDPVAQLGKALFFTRGLGGDMQVACVTCHHPELGGGDALSLPVGVDAVDPLMLGPGRTHAIDGHPNVPRNAPTIFNIGLWDRSIFWDGRIENLSTSAVNNGVGASIRTPDSAFGIPDSGAGNNLTAAQAKFPVTSAAEMRSDHFELDADNETLRQRLAARLGGYGAGAGELAENNWYNAFAAAYNLPQDNSESLVNYSRIAHAIGEYERSMIFVDNPFSDWVNGNSSALNESQKQGALLFFTDIQEGGAGCFRCHSGDFFTDEELHAVATIQIGEGKGDGNFDDFGRERETGDPNDRYKFRTPTLLNVEVTGPYGHAGAYDTLEQVVAHFSDPEAATRRWFEQGGTCALDQFSALPECATMYPEAQANSELALSHLQQQRNSGSAAFSDANLTISQQADVVEFLKALTDPCVKDPQCMAPWIADPESTGHDGMQLNGIDQQGRVFGM